MSATSIRLWADAFRRAKAGKTVAVRVDIEQGEQVLVFPVDVATEHLGEPVAAVVTVSERVNGACRIQLWFDATPRPSAR